MLFSGIEYFVEGKATRILHALARPAPEPMTCFVHKLAEFFKRKVKFSMWCSLLKNSATTRGVFVTCFKSPPEPKQRSGIPVRMNGEFWMRIDDRMDIKEYISLRLKAFLASGRKIWRIFVWPGVTLTRFGDRWRLIISSLFIVCFILSFDIYLRINM